MSATPSSNSFVKLRRGILEHIEKGLLPANELAAYVYIILRADHNTGVWTGSALRLARAFGVSWPTGKVWLRALRAKGYIDCHPSRAQRGDYPILVLRYRPAKKQAELFPDEGSRLASEGSPLCSRGQPATPFEGSRLPPSTQEVESIRREVNPAAKPAPPADPHHHEFWSYAITEYERVRGEKPAWAGKEAKRLAELLKTLPGLSVEELKRRWQFYLASTDGFVLRNGYGLCVFCDKWNALRNGPLHRQSDAQGPKPAAPPHIPGPQDIVPRQRTWPEVRNA